jgi:hypothetical protein
LALRGSGWLGHSAALHSHASLHPHFYGCWNAPRSLIAAAKTSYTAGTLCAIAAKNYVVILAIKHNVRLLELECDLWKQMKFLALISGNRLNTKTVFI